MAAAGVAGAATGLGIRQSIVDAFGDTLAAGPYPARIVSLSPSLTEMLFALGVSPERIIGVTTFCDYPPEVVARPRVGGIVNPSIEQILVQSPDLVLVTRGNPLPVIVRLRGLGIPTFALDDRGGIEDVGRLMRKILAVSGSDDPQKADSTLDRFDSVIRLYDAWSRALSPEDRPSVYYSDPENPEWTAGPGSHIDDLIRLGGGINVVREGGSWPRFSVERLLMLQPDVLLLSLPDGADRKDLRGLAQSRPGLKSLKAVLSDRTCWVDAGCLLRPGPRSVIALQAIAACLHPESHPALEPRVGLEGVRQ